MGIAKQIPMLYPKTISHILECRYVIAELENCTGFKAKHMHNMRNGFTEKLKTC